MMINRNLKAEDSFPLLSTLYPATSPLPLNQWLRDIVSLVISSDRYGEEAFFLWRVSNINSFICFYSLVNSLQYSSKKRTFTSL